MLLKIKNKNNFIRSFLTPISRLTTTVTLEINNSHITATFHNNSNIFVNTRYEIEWQEREGVTLCLPDVNKLIKILHCIQEDDINLKLENNSIKYSNKKNRFTYHLFDEAFKIKNEFDFNRINQLKDWVDITLTKETNTSLLKAMPFVPDTSKLYLFAENNSIYAELTDKKIQNVDTYTTEITDTFAGTLNQELILDIELFRLISTLNFDKCDLYINDEFKMVKLVINIECCDIIFVSTSFKN